MILTAKRPPHLIDEAALRCAEEAPGKRAEQRRDIIGDRHQLL